MIKQNALKYLGYLNNQIDKKTDLLLDECLLELSKVQPKFVYQIYTLKHHPLKIKELNISLNYPELIDLFAVSYTHLNNHPSRFINHNYIFILINNI